MIKEQIKEEIGKWENVITILNAHVESINKTLEESDDATDTTELINRLQQIDTSMFEAKVAIRTLTWVLSLKDDETEDAVIEEDE